MHIGLGLECDYREGQTQDEAFDDAFSMADAAEEWGFDGVWLAEHHFVRSWESPVGHPSVVASPLIWATAIASRTSRIRVGTSVLVLPLGHPVRMAEEVATLDNISRGRFDLGIGRSALPHFYHGYNVDYTESHGRFLEYLEVMRAAWTQERFTYEGKYFNLQDVCLMPKPYQKPHPPLRAAATTIETFPLMGGLGLPLFVLANRLGVSGLAPAIQEYRAAWREAGHPGDGDVMLRLPVYVEEDMERALSEPEASTMGHYARLGMNLRNVLRSAGEAGAAESEQQVEQAERLASITYEDLLRERLVYGTPETVTKRLAEVADELGLSGVVIEPNVGAHVPQEQVLNSMRLFAEEVAPALR